MGNRGFWGFKDQGLSTQQVAAGYDVNLAAVSGLACWYKAGTGLTYNASNRVSSWADSVGANNATQATDARKPLYLQLASLYPVLSFDGIDDFLSTNCVPQTGNGGRTLLAVLRNGMSGDSGNYRHLLHYGTGATGQAYGMTLRTNGVAVTGNHYWTSYGYSAAAAEFGPAVLINTYDGTTDRYYYNNFALGSNVVALNTGSGSGMQIGSRISPPYECGRVWLWEVAAWNVVLSDADRSAVTAALMAKFGITMQ